jgi:hypothetical protein
MFVFRSQEGDSLTDAGVLGFSVLEENNSPTNTGLLVVAIYNEARLTQLADCTLRY